ncbi:hypothetical protein [Nocardiopsis ansamitocini]|uniref:Uncharacterized protein n=1 Tax=Nocardiopsis ansamitocini TaxID=1670832 RepID=A0A9W6UHB6_9ACTN|nr:hypothetical protein [Nocardiopsis ansamitocini]GLU48691.1 hypothetical protein Nans01_30420 [Nocardiopsis ansamitocini]
MTGQRAGAGSRRRGPSPAFNLALLTLALLLVYLAVSNLDRGIRAATADGAPGTFTAASLACIQHPGHESCTCYGTYTADDGAAPRDDVYLYGADRATCVIDQDTRAVDIGAPNRVYGPEGSREWMFTAGLLLAGLALATASTTNLVRARLLRGGGRPPENDTVHHYGPGKEGPTAEEGR